MKLSRFYPLLFAFAWLAGCQYINKEKKEQEFPELYLIPEKPNNTDNRPKAEIAFLSRVLAESDYNVTSNAASKDSHISAFNKYAVDSLKQIANWEMIVDEVNDNEFSSSTAGKILFSDTEVYNVKMVAPVKIDRSIDTIAIDNEVEFTLTIPKNPKTDTLKKQLSVIQTLKKGDTVIISGALTHLDKNGKINFASFYDQMLPWNVDVLQTAIHKKQDN